ncbi:MAG: ComEC/Rec2 family competence protein, partial [Oscillospiraceae bacterium]|nr:ComEC/Rec2 family competence protein [Oscillospiraceae bacterium]
SFVRSLFPEDAKYRRFRAAGAAVFTLLMMGITGFTPSVCRAGIVMLLFCLGEFLLAPTDGFTSLGFAALVLCLANGYAACDIGFQLSFLATSGVLLAEELSARLEENDRFPDWANDLTETLVDLLLPSLLAALATLPIQLVHGLSVSGVAVFANIAALWLIQPILILGALIALCGLFPILRYSALFFSIAEEWLIHLLYDVLEFFAGLPAASLDLPVRFTLFVLLVWAAAVLFSYLRRDKRLFALLTGVIVVLGCAFGAVLSHGVVRATLVGNASAPAVVITQDKNACVLFRGGRYNQRKAEEYLEEKGIEKADFWVTMSQEKSTVAWEGKTVIHMEELARDRVQELSVGDCRLSLLNQAEGNLALVQVDGFTVAAAAGNIVLPQKIAIDVYLGGAANPEFAEVDRYLTTSQTYPWLEKTEESDVVYSRNRPYVEIRPGRSAQILKGEKPFG